MSGAVPKPESQIESELNDLGLLLSGLDGSVRSLRGQLAQVLIEDPAMCCGSDRAITPAPALCPIAMRIKALREIASEIASVVDDIQRRVRC